MEIIVNPKIRLTEFRRTDKQRLIEHLSERDIYDRTLRIPHPYTAADADRWLESVEELARRTGEVVQWAIRDEHDALVGGIGLDGFLGAHPHRVELGYWLAKAFWGQGIMTAVVDAVCRHAFEKLGLVKITAFVHSFNRASARVLQKCGFAQEGFCPKHFAKDGGFIDVMMFGLIPTTAPREEIAPHGLTIRAYQHRDEEQIARLWQTAFPDDPPYNDPSTVIETKLTIQRDLFLVGERSNSVVATVMAGFDGHRGWIYRVAVDPQFRRLGIGRAMMTEAEQLLAQMGCTKINLQVRETNRTVIEFYKSLGFEIEDRISMGKRVK